LRRRREWLLVLVVGVLLLLMGLRGRKGWLLLKTLLLVFLFQAPRVFNPLLWW